MASRTLRHRAKSAFLSATLAASVLVPLSAPAPAFAATTEGSVGGTVRDADGVGLSGVCVSAFDLDGNVAGRDAGASEKTTNSSGVYFLDGLTAGTYKLRFRDCGTQYGPLLDQDFATLYSGGAISFQEATSFSINADEADSDDSGTTGNSPDKTENVVLGADGTFNGTIRDVVDNSGLAGVCIQVIDAGPSGALIVETASLGGDSTTIGKYSFRGLPEGTFHVLFRDDLDNCGSLDRPAGLGFENNSRTELVSSSPNTHANEYFDNVPLLADAANVEIPLNGSTAAPIDASLSRISQSQGVQGTVRDDSGAVVPGACLTAYREDGFTRPATANVQGVYSIPLTPESYWIEVHERCSTNLVGPSDDLYVAEFFNNVTYDDDAAPTKVSPTIDDFSPKPATSARVTVAANAFTTVNPTVAKRGSISGTVTDEASPAQPVAGVCVIALEGQLGPNDPLPFAITQADGTFSIPNLRPDTYALRFSPTPSSDSTVTGAGTCDGATSKPAFLAEYYNGAAARTGATTVVVSNGAAATGRSASLRDASSVRTIAGRVTDAGNAGVIGVCVNVLDLDGEVKGFAKTRADDTSTTTVDEAGTYETSGVPQGQYKIEFARPDTCDATVTTAPGNPLYIATEYHNNAATFAGGTIVTVGASNVTGINAQVEGGARVAGTVTNNGAESICVELTLTNGTVQRSLQTTAGYAMEALRPGQYYVRFDDRDPNGTCGGVAFADSQDTYRTEWFDNKFSQVDATPITLQAGTNRSGATAVNAAMNFVTSGGATFTKVTGYVEDGNNNAINGVIVEFFRFDQDPAVDAPVFTATSGRRDVGVVQRRCATIKIQDPEGGEPIDTGERPDPCTSSDPSEIHELTITANGYWEVTDATQPGGPEALVAGSYKVRFRDPKGIYATEWYRSSATFGAAVSVVVGGADTKVVELGERRADRDNYDADITDDNNASEFLENDPGDSTDLDDQPQCWWVRRADCDVDALPTSTGSSEFITDLSPAGTVDGKVTVEQTGTPVQNARVDLLTEEGAVIAASGFTKADGTYRILGIAPGGYKAQFTPADANLAGEYFKDQATFGSADIIAVGANSTKSAVNGTLKQNTAPKAGDDTRQAEINKSTTWNDLLSNDVDPEGDALSIKSVGSATNGNVVLNEDGSVTFTAATDNTEDASFTYTVADPRGLTDTATVTVKMVGEIIGFPPNAVDDEVSTAMNTAVTVNVLANDSDPDGTAPLQLTSVGTPFHGTAVISGTSVRYTPDTGFSGIDQFSYEVTDAQGFTANARVTVNVNASGVVSASKTVAAGGTVSTEGTTATADNPIITSVTTPNAGTVTIREEQVAAGQVSDITTLTWRSVIEAPNATASNPLTITFRLDGSLIQGVEQPARAIRVLRNNALVGDCLGSKTASPDPCISGHRMVGDDVLVTIKTSAASTWTFGFDNDAVVDRASGASGTGRVGTAVAVSRNAYSPSEVDTVVIARKDAYPDALAGAPLAHQLGAPMLLTTKDSLDAITREEIVRLGASRVVILGGTAAVSSGVETSLRGIPGVSQVDRIRGADRFATAAAVAQQLNSYDSAYVVEGADVDLSRGWPDAVAVASLAAFQGRPILLVTTEELPTATRNALSGLREAVIIGGTASVSTNVANAIDGVVGTVGRVRGTDRYETSFAVAQRAVSAGMSASSVWVATGQNFPDALAAGPAVAKEGGIMLLVNGTNYDASPAVDRFLTANRTKVESLTIVGGTAVISVGSEVRMGQATQN